MSGAALVFHQFRYDQKTFWRDPASVFFTVLLPLIFLFIFATIFGNETIEELGGIKTSTYYVPAIITLAVVSATMVSPAISLTQDRENGVLKRVRGTPLPSWVFIAGRVGNAVVISLLMAVVLTLIGRVVYDVAIPDTTLPAALLTLVVGAAAFNCIGIALTVAIPSQDAAPAVTNAVALPLYFISGIFIPETEIPDGVLQVADVFPFRHFFEALFDAFDPATTGSALELGNLAVVALWGSAALRDRRAVVPLDPARRVAPQGLRIAVLRVDCEDDPPRHAGGVRPRAQRELLRRRPRAARVATPRRRHAPGRMGDRQAVDLHRAERRCSARDRARCASPPRGWRR